MANLIERLTRFLSLGALGFRLAGSEIKLVILFGKGRRVPRAMLSELRRVVRDFEEARRHGMVAFE